MNIVITFAQHAVAQYGAIQCMVAFIFVLFIGAVSVGTSR